MNRHEWAEENGYSPTPEEAHQDTQHEPGRSYRGPRGPVREKVWEPWADSLSTRAERMWAGEAS